MAGALPIQEPFVPRRAQVGEWRLSELSDGFLRLDGGSMWGVVPRNLWAKFTPPEADNTIRLALRPFLAEKGGVVALIEPGIGDRWDAKSRAIYSLEREPTLAASLAASGVRPEQVTHVVLSHCHWDHAGAAVVSRDGALVPLFPSARHFAPAIEIERAKRPGHARAASYRADDVLALERAGVLESFEGRAEIVPGLVAHVLGGHSDGVSVVTVGDEHGECAIFWSDVVPTTHHVQPPYIMAYDLDVARSFEARSEWLARAAERGWLGLFYHDQHTAFARIARDGKRYVAQPVD
jgi:glyoxylase-like metal-dependent hydrolase (beta-lactamase superfamily II)